MRRAGCIAVSPSARQQPRAPPSAPAHGDAGPICCTFGDLMLRIIGVILLAGLGCARAPVPADRASAQAKGSEPEAPVERIRARVAEVDAAIQAVHPTVSIYMATLDGPWRAVKSEDACDADEDERGDYPCSCALVSRVDGKIARVVEKRRTPSGDWVARVTSTFWPTGGIAFRLEELFPAGCLVREEGDEVDSCGDETREYWDESGRHVRT